MKISENFNKLLDNWPVKAVCLLIALFVYIFYNLSIQESRSFTVPLEVRSQNGISPASNHLKKVRITLKGKTEEIASVRENEVTAYLDLNHLAKDGTYKVPVSIDLPKSALMLDTLEVSVAPQNVSLKVEESISGWVKVNPLISGTPAHGYEIKSINVYPDEIEIYGPRSLVENCTRIQTQVVSVKNASTSLEKAVIPENLGAFLKHVSGEKLRVEVEIGPVISEKSFDNIPLIFVNPAQDFEVIPAISSVKITVSGNLLEMEKFTPEKDCAKIDCSSITEEGDFELPVKYSIPDSLSVIDGPATVKVMMKKSKPADLPEEVSPGKAEHQAGEISR